MKKIIIIGGGGHARVLRDTLEVCGQSSILGYTDLKPSPSMGLKYLGTDEVLKQHAPDQVRLINGIGSVHLPQLRQKIYAQLKEQGFEFVTIVHPKAFVSPGAILGEGAQVMAGAVVITGAKIGANVIINTLSGIDHDCVIGAHTHIAPGVTLSGDVHIGEGCHIGTGAKIIHGIRIGPGILIKAGAVVIEDVSVGQTVPGKGTGK